MVMESHWQVVRNGSMYNPPGSPFRVGTRTGGKTTGIAADARTCAGPILAGLWSIGRSSSEGGSGSEQAWSRNTTVRYRRLMW